MDLPDEFEAAYAASIRKFGPCVDARGLRVAQVTRITRGEGRRWSLDEYVEGELYREVFLVAEDGRLLAEGEWVVDTRSSEERGVRRARLEMAGYHGVPLTSATSRWLPVRSRAPVYANEWDARDAWADATRAAAVPTPTAAEAAVPTPTAAEAAPETAFAAAWRVAKAK